MKYNGSTDIYLIYEPLTSYGNITVHHVTEDGSQIQGIDDETIGLYQNRSGELTGDDIDGYSFLDTKLGNSTNGTSVTSYEVTETYGNVTISFLDEYGDIISTDTYSGTDKHYDVYEIYQAQKIGSISYGTLENGTFAELGTQPKVSFNGDEVLAKEIEGYVYQKTQVVSKYGRTFEVLPVLM